MMLFIGGLIRELHKWSSIPYTPMLLMIGITIGVVSSAIAKSAYHESIEHLVGIDPHTMLQIFIPGLVFESAFNSDGWVLNRSKWQVLMLAGPGVAITMFLIAIILKYVLWYNDSLTWSQSLVIGSILATTDPVAVVALLKELGTSVKFNTLLEGESLVNDGTAFVFFLVCLDVVRTGQFSFKDGLAQFLQLTFGGPAIGLIFGILSVLWLRYIIKDVVLGVAITFFTVYLCFFLCESVLHVSGILAIVILGLFLGTHGKIRMSENTEHS